MSISRLFEVLVLAAALAGCAELTAEHPLFTPADQTGAPPLNEGVWIVVSDECPATYVQQTSAFPKACAPLQISREPDGAWRVQWRADLISDLTADERAEANNSAPRRFVVVPVVRRPLEPGSFAPLYVVEFEAREDSAVSYALIAPLGAMPADESLLLASISCASVLRDGPVEGITPRYSEPPEGQAPALTGCIASDPAAVREAARRALLENLEEMTRGRLVRLQP